VRYPWSDYTVDLGFWVQSSGAESDVLRAAIPVPDLGDQRRAIEGERL